MHNSTTHIRAMLTLSSLTTSIDDGELRRQGLLRCLGVA